MPSLHTQLHQVWHTIPNHFLLIHLICWGGRVSLHLKFDIWPCLKTCQLSAIELVGEWQSKTKIGSLWKPGTKCLLMIDLKLECCWRFYGFYIQFLWTSSYKYGPSNHSTLTLPLDVCQNPQWPNLRTPVNRVQQDPTNLTTSLEHPYHILVRIQVLMVRIFDPNVL